MSNGAREKIFKALVDSSGHKQPENDIAIAANNLLRDVNDIRPKINQDVVTAFIDRVNGPKVGASVSCVQSMNDVPLQVSELLIRENLPASIRLQAVEPLTQLDWQRAELQTSTTDTGNVAVGIAKYGIAETGSIVVHSGPDTAILFSFLPEVYIVVVRADDLVMYLEDYADTALGAGQPHPRNVCLITGASGTTDIEGELVIGAHGPRLVHVIVVDPLVH